MMKLDVLFIIIVTYKNFNAKCYSLPYFLGTSSRSWSWRVWWKKMWDFRLHLVLAFPSELWTSFRFPTNLNDRNATALEFLDSSIYDLDGFLDNVHSFIDLHIFKRDMEVLIC